MSTRTSGPYVPSGLLPPRISPIVEEEDDPVIIPESASSNSVSTTDSCSTCSTKSSSSGSPNSDFRQQLTLLPYGKAGMTTYYKGSAIYEEKFTEDERCEIDAGLRRIDVILEDMGRGESAPSESKPSNSLTNINTNIVRPSGDSQISDSSAFQEQVLTDDEKAFVRATGYLLDKSIPRSKSRTVECVRIIFALVRKLAPDHFEGKDVNVETVAKAVVHVGSKRAIVKALKKSHPYVAIGLEVSQLTDIFKDSLQDMIVSEYKRNQPSWGEETNTTGLRAIYNNLLIYNYWVVEAAAWPIQRIDNFLTNRVVDPAWSLGKEAIEDYVAFGKSVWDVLKPDRLDDPLPEEERRQLCENWQQRDALAAHLGSAKGHEDGGDYELYDQLTSAEEYALLFEGETPKDEKKFINHNGPPDLTYQPPLPDWSPPIKKFLETHLGGSISLSGGSGTPTQFSGQINFTVGPKNLPPINAPLGFGQSDPTIGGPYRGGVRSYPISNAINNARTKFENSYGKYKTKEEELRTLQASGTDNESPDSIIDRKNREINLVNELKPLMKTAMDDAWAVRQLTRKEAAREYKKELASQCNKINDDIKNVLWNDFQVPRGTRLTKHDLAKAGKYKTLDDIKTSAETSRNHAQQDKAISATEKQFEEADKLVVALETSSGPVDPAKLSDALASLKIFGEQLVSQIRARGDGSAEEITNKINSIEGRIATLSDRDLRYGVILSGYVEFKKLEATLTSQIQAGGNDAEISVGLTRAANQKEVVDAQIAELMDQAPENTEKNAALVQVRNDISSEYLRLSLSKQNKDIRETYQQYRETREAILKMEGSNEPVDPNALSAAQEKMQTLGEQLIVLSRGKAALSPESITQADLANNENQIRGEIAAVMSRDARYENILSYYQNFGDLEKNFLSQLLLSDNQEGAAEVESQKTTFDNLIAELIQQCPDNAEKNAGLLLLQKEVASRFGALSFCMKPDAEKTAELHSIRDQIDSAPSSDERSEAVDAYLRRTSLFSLQVAACGDYKRFSENFNNFASVLAKEETLTADKVTLLDNLCKILIAGVADKKIDATTALPVLEAMDKKHSSQQVQLTIGSLYCMSEQSKTAVALKYYQQCRIHQPDNSLWPKCQALCQMETFRYSEAQKAILDALEMDPNNEENRKAANLIVKDQYDNLSLLLEWLEMGFQAGTDRFLKNKKDCIQTLEDEEAISQAISEFRGYVLALKSLQGALHVATHPTFVLRGLSYFFPPLEGLEATLADVLAKDKAYAFNALNMATIATRAIPAIADVICTAFPEEQYPLLFDCATQTAMASKDLQTYLSGYQTYKSLSNLWSHYSSGNLSLSSAISSGAVGTLTTLSSATRFVQSRYYTNEEEKLKSQRSRPALNAAINTVASTEFAGAVSLSGLAWQAEPMLARAGARAISVIVPDCTSEDVSTYLKVAIVGGLGIYLVPKIRNIFSEAKAKIMGTSHTNIGMKDYWYSWWDYFSAEPENG